MDLIAHDGAKNNKSPLAYIVVTSEWYHGLWTPSKAFFQRISNVLADWEFFGVVSVAFSAHILLLCLPAPNTRLISYFFRQVRGIPLCFWLLVLAFKNLESRHHASIVRGSGNGRDSELGRLTVSTLSFPTLTCLLEIDGSI